MMSAAQPFAVTLFQDFAARSKQLQKFTLEGLQERILQTSAPAKAGLPWLKLAHFGDIRTDANSLRHNSNVLAITGIEADYDGGAMPFEEAVTLVTEAGLQALVYTSPSHTPEAPRWRVLCLRIPTEGGRRFQRKADTDSDGSRTVVPIDPG